MGKLFVPYIWIIESTGPNGEHEIEQRYGMYRNEERAQRTARKQTAWHADRACLTKHGWKFEAVRYGRMP
jgi:hypothetical protein